MSQQRLQPSDVFPVPGDQAARSERDEILTHQHLTESGDHISVAETDLPGKRVVTATARGQVMAQFAIQDPSPRGSDISGEAVTIGEALEAAAVADKPVKAADVAAIQAAEARATGLGRIVRGGIAQEAQAAAAKNARTEEEEEKIKLSDVLSDATELLPKDKVVTRADAERVRAAEMRNSRGEESVAMAMAMEAAARMNQP